MKKVSTAVSHQGRIFSQPTLTIGLDLGDRNSWYCVLVALSNSNLSDRDPSGMIRRAQKAIQRSKQLMNRTEELLRESRASLKGKPILPWATVRKAQ